MPVTGATIGMDGISLNAASIAVTQDGIKSFFSALINAQTYEIFVDDQKVGVLNGYQTRQMCTLPPGPHTIYVRAYARDSVSITRVYGYSQKLSVDMAAGEHKSFSCGLMPGPPLRKYLFWGSFLIMTLLVIGAATLTQIPEHTRYAAVMFMALVTLACSWYGYSSKPGSGIYLRQRSASVHASPSLTAEVQ